MFSVIYYIVLSSDQPIDDVCASFIAEIKGDNIILTHYGGESIMLENSEISTVIGGKTFTNFTHNDLNNNSKWDVGETIEYHYANISSLEVEVTIADAQTNTLLFTGIIQEGDTSLGPLQLNTSVNKIAGYLQTNPSISLKATGDARLTSVELWYRYSNDNTSWSGNRTIGEIRIIENVGSSWMQVDFWNTYSKPVIIPTYNLESKTYSEACVRIKDVESTGCEIMIQNPGDDHTVTSGDVHLLVIEQGSHYLNDERKIEAYRSVESATAENNNWGQIGTLQTYSHTYSTPVVLASIMSYNDTDWSVPYFTDGNRANPPSTSALYTSKHVGEDTDTSRNVETIGYVVLEQGTGTIDDISYEAALGSDHVDGTSNNGYSYSLSDVFSVGVASQGGMDGTDGSWTVLYGSNPISSTLTVACEEDTIKDSDRAHTTEQVSYWVFSKEGNITSNESLDSGWILWNDSANPDTKSPWKWNFDFPEGLGYYEFYSIGRNGTENETPPPTNQPDTRCRFTIGSYVNNIIPYSQTSSPLSLSATASNEYDNLTLYYRWSNDNATWASGWYDENWSYRKKITINASQIDATLKQFPIHVRIDSDGDLSSNAQPDGDDIFFVYSGVQLNHEIEAYSSGSLKAWVNVTKLSSDQDSIIYMYYGNSTCGSQENRDGTWDSSYIGVWHYKEGSGTTVGESTSHNHDGYLFGSSPSSYWTSSGKIGNGYSYNNAQYTAIQNLSFSGVNDISEITVEAWFKTSGSGGNGYNNWALLDYDRSEYFDLSIADGDYSGVSEGCLWFATKGGNLDDFGGTTMVNDGQWHYGVGVFNGNDKIIYVDGEEDARKINAHTNAGLGTSTTRYGFMGDGSEAISYNGNRNYYYYEGVLDEVRFSLVTRNASWIKATYQAIQNPSSFMEIGNEETYAGGDGINWKIYTNDTNPDENSPWSWSFDFPYGQGYYQFFSIARYLLDTEDITYVAEAICYKN